MSEKINVLIGANIEGLKTALAESGRSLSEFGTLAQQAPKKAKTAVDELNKSYRDAVRDAKNLALMQGQTSEAFYEAQLKAKNLKSQIEGLNQVVGQTGKIASGSGGIQQASQKFDMLGHSVSQITRELPAFTNSMTTGFMAISNNIPMLVDQINNISRANQALAASGQPVKSVFSQLVGSLFSWQTALSLAVTALTIFGARIVESISNTDAAARSLSFLETQTSKFTNSIIDQTGELYKRNEQLRISLGMAKNGTLMDEELIKINNIKIQQAKDLLYENELSKSVQLARFLSGEKAILLSKFEVEAVNNEIKALNDQNKALQANIEIQKQLQQIKENAKNFRQRKDESIQIISTRSFEIPELKGMASGALNKIVQDALDVRWADVNAKALKGMGEWRANFDGFITKVREAALTLNDVVRASMNALGDLIQTATFRTAAEGDNFGEALIGSLLGSMGKFMSAWGSQLILVGIGAEALKASLASLNGVGAIIAGTALVIAGSAATKMASNMANNPRGAGGGSGGSYSSSNSGAGATIPSFNPTGMMISIDGMVRGNNIVVALDNQTRMNRRVR
jgi:hypothetical protein